MKFYLCNNCNQVPIKVIHGDKDFIVPLSESRKIVNAVKKCNDKAPIEFEIVKGANHGSVEDFYRHIELYDWLLQHSKTPQNFLLFFFLPPPPPSAPPLI